MARAAVGAIRRDLPAVSVLVHPRLIVRLRAGLLEGGFKIEALDAKSLACDCALDLRGRGIVDWLLSCFDRMRPTASLAPFSLAVNLQLSKNA